MKLINIIPESPEVSEDKLLEIIAKEKKTYRWVYNWNAKDILAEYDLIQQKQSKLTKSHRDQICILVSRCMILMVKDGRKGNNND